MVTFIVLLCMVFLIFRFYYEKPENENCNHGSNLKAWFFTNSALVILLAFLRVIAFLNVSQNKVVSRTASKKQMRLISAFAQFAHAFIIVHGIVAYLCDFTKNCDGSSSDLSDMISMVSLVIMLLQLVVYSVYFAHELKDFLQRQQRV